jgi:hypothetical protein
LAARRPQKGVRMDELKYNFNAEPPSVPPKGGLKNSIPLNHNYLSPLNFEFALKRAPHVQFFIQRVNIPGLRLEPPVFATPFVGVPEPGEHLTYDNLNISFKIDEDLLNYLEIHNWLKSLGKPKNFGEYKELSEQPQFIGQGLKSDISLIVMSNIKNPNYVVNFIDAFPMYLSSISFNTTDPDVTYLQADAIFKYTYYDIEVVK